MASLTPEEPMLDAADPSSSALSKSEKLEITPTFTNPPTFSLRHLLVSDPNPLPPSPDNAILATHARSAAQALINQLLTTCTIQSTPAGVYLTLPHSTIADETRLPRAKPLPKEKTKSKWEVFAAKKGIRPKTRDERNSGKQVFDEETGEWVRKWGYKGKNKEGEGDWLVEVDDKPGVAKSGEAKGKGGVKFKTAEEGGRNVRGEGRRERVERVKRNERRMRANEAKGRKASGGRS